MADLNSMAKESLSKLLVRDLEESRGCTLKITGRRTGFNGLSVQNGSIIRKIELKTVDKSDYWFAINGLYGIESLFFDPQYYLYFVLINEHKVLIAHAIPFLKAQIPLYNTDVGDDMKEWLALTRTLGTKAGLNIIPRINFKLRLGIRSLARLLEAREEADEWLKCIDSIWQSHGPQSWEKTFPSEAPRGR